MSWDIMGNIITFFLVSWLVVTFVELLPSFCKFFNILEKLNLLNCQCL